MTGGKCLLQFATRGSRRGTAVYPPPTPTLEAPPIRSEMNTHGIEKCDQKVHEKSGPKFNRNLNHIREITNMKEQAKSLQNTVQDEIHSQQYGKPLKNSHKNTPT